MTNQYEDLKNVIKTFSAEWIYKITNRMLDKDKWLLEDQYFLKILEAEFNLIDEELEWIANIDMQTALHNYCVRKWITAKEIKNLYNKLSK